MSSKTRKTKTAKTSQQSQQQQNINIQVRSTSNEPIIIGDINQTM